MLIESSSCLFLLTQAVVPVYAHVLPPFPDTFEMPHIDYLPDPYIVGIVGMVGMVGTQLHCCIDSMDACTDSCFAVGQDIFLQQFYVRL